MEQAAVAAGAQTLAIPGTAATTNLSFLISRGNFIRSLYGFAGMPPTAGLNPHGLSDVTPFYENAVTWAKHFGLADGFADNTFRQADNITRGNATRIPYNLAQTPTAWDDTMTAPANMLFKVQPRPLTPARRAPAGIAYAPSVVPGTTRGP